MKNIAIIPARSGSKGLKDKNIKELNGKPLIWYSIQAALESECFDEVMVSTDSKKYAEIALQCGASVPFLRSDEMSADNAGTWEAIREVLLMYSEMGREFDNVMLLQPTSPLRVKEDIKNAFELFVDKKANSIVGVCEVEHSPLWCNILPDDKCLSNFITDEVKKYKGRQEISQYYRVNGAIYLTKISYKDMKFDLYDDKSYAYCMPQTRSVDIDTELDFILASSIMDYYNIKRV